jgi:UDP-N-acetylmuramoyl-tripeptide--D-alanyl-D-alanine ligase
LRLAEVSSKIDGKLVGKDEKISKFITDSRACKNGDLFFAMKGERLDGHDFIKDVYAKGGFCVSEHPIPFSPYILVKNSKDSLLKLALSKIEPVFKIAITGSNGKTTTKEILSALLEKHGKVLKTEGNLNTDIGISLSILNGPSDPDFCVIEIGAQFPGDVGKISEIFSPDLSIVTSVGSAHSEFIDVPKEKSSIASYTKDAVIYDGDQRLSLENKGIVYKRFVEFEAYDGLKTLLKSGNKRIVLSEIWGEGQIKDLNMALSTLNYMGIKWKVEDLEFIDLPRMKAERIGSYFLVDDTYNASPESLFNSAKAFSRIGRVIWVLAPMKELKKDGIEEMLKGFFEELSPKAVFKVNDDENFYPFGMAYTFEKLFQILEKNDIILVKGSRFYKMEKVVQEIKEGLGKNDRYY